MSDFEKRKTKGKALEDRLKSYLSKEGIDYFVTGYEGLNSSKNARDKIKFNSATTSFFVRHYPDVTMASRKDSFLIEVKNSTGIEKDCFANYLSLSKSLNLNVMLFLRNHKIYNVCDIVFQKQSGYDYLAKMQIPITDGIWKEPRKMDENNYHKYLNAYRAKGKYTSGCSFAFIDFEKSKGYDLNVLKQLDKKYS